MTNDTTSDAPVGGRMSDEEFQRYVRLERIGPDTQIGVLVAEARRARESEERLKEAIKKAPHAETCQTTYCVLESTGDMRSAGLPCDCWKARALAGGEEGE